MKTNENSGAEKKLAEQSSRIRLKRRAQSVLNVQGLTPKEQHRTVWCGRGFKFGDYGTGDDGHVDVFRNPDRDGANFSGLLRCGNIHTCPECAVKIGELRRKQLSVASVRHCKDNGGGMYLVTLTSPHSAEFGDDSEARLVEWLKKFDKARDKFRNSPKWKAFRKAAGNIKIRRKNKKTNEPEEVLDVGVVTSLEFTISMENGWHPHLHLLVFCKKKGFGDDEKVIKEETDYYCKDDVASYMIDELKQEWVNCLFKAGLGENRKLTDMMKRALNVRGGEKAAEYIAKMGREQVIFVDDEGNKTKRWTLSREMACTHAKTGAAGVHWGEQHVTPFQLLAWTAKPKNETDEERTQRKWAYFRFKDYAAAVEGKQALRWTNGLKIALGVEDVDEEKWAADDKPRPEQIHVGRICAADFSKLLKKKQEDEFLVYVATCCDTQEHMDEFIATLDGLPDKGGGTLIVKRREGRAVVYA